jgi:hypothetical protein
MKVANLQLFLRTLAEPLAASGAKQIAGELERACASLEPFREYSIKDFADFLAKAEEYSRTGVLSAQGKRKEGAAKVIHSQRILELAQQINALCEQAVDGDVELTDVEEELKQLDKALNAQEVIALAQEVGAGKHKSKKAALQGIRLMIKDRKRSFERTESATSEEEAAVPGEPAKAPTDLTPSAPPAVG